MIAIALMLTFQDALIERNVDRIERNHVGDLDQLIFWKWRGWPRDKWEVVDWRIYESHPRRQGGRWVVSWYERGRRIRVYAPRFSETWTLTDPEIDDRLYWPSAKRKVLIPGVHQ